MQKHTALQIFLFLLFLVVIIAGGWSFWGTESVVVTPGRNPLGPAAGQEEVAPAPYVPSDEELRGQHAREYQADYAAMAKTAEAVLAGLAKWQARELANYASRPSKRSLDRLYPRNLGGSGRNRLCSERFPCFSDVLDTPVSTGRWWRQGENTYLYDLNKNSRFSDIYVDYLYTYTRFGGRFEGSPIKPLENTP